MPGMSGQSSGSRNAAAARSTPIFMSVASAAPGSGSNYTPQQLSPNYGLGAGGSTRTTSLFGQQRSAAGGFPPDRSRQMPGSTGGMQVFGVRGGYGSSQGGGIFHSFGTGGDSATPPLLDPSEFPSLTNRAGGLGGAGGPLGGGGGVDSMLQPSPMPGKAPYGETARAPTAAGRSKTSLQDLFGAKVGMVKQPTNESSEFTISSEDFPALPGTQAGAGKDSQQQNVSDKSGSELGVDGESATSRAPGAERQQQTGQQGSQQGQQQQQERGVQTHANGRVTNIPNSMVRDQFGIVGLLTFIRVAETEPSLVAMSLGQDLKNLGLNLNSPENIYPNFGGPFADVPCRPQDIDYHVPHEYLVNAAIRDKLPVPKLNHYKEDLLFYFFYCYPGDSVQLAAATELFNRDWRYHTEEKVWISRAPGASLLDKTSSYERGTYYCFDPQKWRKLAKEFLLEYSKLEERPPMPQPQQVPQPSVPQLPGVVPPQQQAHMYPPPPGMQQPTPAM